MKLELTESQQAFKAEVREFAEREIKPLATRIDTEGKIPDELIRKVAARGYMGISIPEEFGGLGKDTVSYALAIEELSRCCASTGVTVTVHTSVGTEVINLFGTEEQKKKYVVPLAKGEMIGAFGLTEPDAGSDAGALKTTAKLDGDEYVINGTKTFILSGSIAGVMTVFAKTDPRKGAKGISAFIVDTASPGYKVIERFDKMGVRGADVAKIVLDNVRVPRENLLGAEGQGFKIALTALDGGRIGIAAQAIGLAQAAFEESLSYAQQRHQFGKPIGAFQAIRWKIANMATAIDAARLLVYRAAQLRDQGVRYSKEASMAKLFATESTINITSDAVQIHGGYGYMKGHVVERIYRDARITAIYEGTSEIQRLVIARDLLK
jgi:butyryl-CoA dehydrogenase